MNPKNSDAAPNAAEAPPFWRREWPLALLLLGATLLAYQPVWRAGFIWDDDAHITSPSLRSWHGLARIWTELGATQQYYPLVHSLFWVEHKIWGDGPLGYHLVNVLLHVVAALLLVQILRRLEIPGAWPAAFIFALHPVEVESVAWVSELKNTFSGVCYLGSALAYLSFDRRRERGDYVVSLGLFAAGLLAKTVIATMPAALLLIIWWRRGKLRWKEDVRPLVPFFIAGVGMGLLTTWVERSMISADLESPASHLSLLERCLIPARAVWFYLGKLVWPHPLIFVYPRWELRREVLGQFLVPAGALLLVAGLLWKWRRRLGAGPLVGLLFFIGTLFPALGFFDIFPFRYSFVADHFQYLAALGPMVLAAGGIEWVLGWMMNGSRSGRFICWAALLAALGTATWHQCAVYADEETLWRATIANNPCSWMAHENLGLLYLRSGRLDEAIAQYRQTLEIKPDSTPALNNLGFAFFKKGETDRAMEQYRKALQVNPNDPSALYNLGFAYLKNGETDNAIAQYRKAMDIMPASAEIRISLASALSAKGETDAAIAQYRNALEIVPENPEALSKLANALLRKGDLEGAMAALQKSNLKSPDALALLYNLGNGFLQKRDFDKAIGCYRSVLETNPRSGDAYANLGVALLQKGQAREARDAWQKALELNPGQIYVQNNLAWLLATSPDASLRNGAKAVSLASQANQLSGNGNPTILHTLAAAYAEEGSFSMATVTARRGLELAAQQNDAPLAATLQEEIKLYQAGTPVRETPR